MQKSRTKRKQDMVYVMGDKCQLCGYQRDIHALEFHHIKSEQKNFSFNKANAVSWEKTKEELKKCILVCANCHREIHSGLITQELQSSYIEKNAQEIDLQLQKIKTHQLVYCKTCGTIISNKATQCVKCAGLTRQVVKRPDRETLKDLIRSTPFTTIGKMYGVTDNAVRKWCSSVKLPCRSSEIKQYTEEEWTKI